MISRLTTTATFSESSFPSSSTGLNILAPPNSHDTSLQHMPNVLIVPPEEEHGINPPWTYFDAETDARVDLATHPDVEEIDIALGIFQQTDNRSPAFSRVTSNESSETVIMPKKNFVGEASSDSKSSSRAMGDDIIEVVKVRRNEGMSDMTNGKTSGLRKSKTFRACASHALKTIRGVTSRKGSFSSSNSAESWPSQDDMANLGEGMEAGVLPRPSTPSVSRRKSMQLSQLFSSTRKRTSSMVTSGTFETAAISATPDVPESPASSDFSIISTPTEESLPTPASSLSDRTNQGGNTRSATLNKRRSFVEKISVLDLQRLFAHPSSKPLSVRDSVPSPPRNTRRDSFPVPPSLPHLSHIRSGDDVFAANSPLQRPHSFHAPSNCYSLSPPQAASSPVVPSHAHSSPEDIPEETSFEAELRLDSLHFDSLHFDPDEFTLRL